MAILWMWPWYGGRYVPRYDTIPTYPIIYVPATRWLCVSPFGWESWGLVGGSSFLVQYSLFLEIYGVVTLTLL